MVPTLRGCCWRHRRISPRAWSSAQSSSANITTVRVWAQVSLGQGLRLTHPTFQNFRSGLLAAGRPHAR